MMPILKYLILGVSLLAILPSARSQSDLPYDFTKGDITLNIDPVKQEIQGKVHYQVRSLEAVDSLYLDARNMSFNEVRFNGKPITYSYDGRRLLIKKRLKSDKKYRLNINYQANPEQAVYFLGWQDSIPGNEQIWTQGQGKYSSHWVPSPDLMEEKATFSIHISMDNRYEVISNGKLKSRKEVKGIAKWFYQMEQPMSSYLLAFAVGDYRVATTISQTGVPILMYTYPQDSLKSEPTYRHTKAIFDFLEAEIGVPYPWQNYKQVPVRDFLYAGMENTGATFFSDGYVIDSLAFADLNYVNVNAHELAHQWFGNLVTETDAAQHWLHEGLATYYAYLSEREIFGEEYYLWKFWDTAQALKQQDEEGEGEALNDPKASSLTFYEKGAWTALMLRDEIGDQAYQTGIRHFLERLAFKNATVAQFFSIMEAACDCSLQEFQEKWFKSDMFPYEECEQYLLSRSTAIRQFKDIQQELITNSADNELLLSNYWKEMTSEELRSRIILRYAKSLSPEFLQITAREGGLKVRQAIALVMPRVTPELKETYESFLEDPSYITIENALYKLWVSFPEDRVRYLDITRGMIGLPNKSLRMTWLLLAMLTPGYGDPPAKAAFERELRGYTSKIYGPEIRQNAFLLIREVLAPTDQYLLDLSQACVHHTWQFRSFARNLLNELLQTDSVKTRLIGMTNKLDQKERSYLKKVLGL